MRSTVIAIFFMSLGTLFAQRDFSKVTIGSEQLSDNVYVLFGAGGNIGVAIGEQYAYVIDDQFGPLTEKIVAHIKTITEKPIQFVLNTHWHGDHTGGNENLAEKGAFVIAHENVRKRMATRQERGGGRVSEPSPEAALPVITFNDKMALHLGDSKSLHVMYVNPAHTDGDSYYYFPEDNVLHMGDNFFVGRYPYIDLYSGGDIDGLISNVTMALGIVDEDTKIIPGHGKVAGKQELQDYKSVLVAIRERVKNAKVSGKTLEETQSMGLTKEWDATHGQGFINAKRIVEFVYKSVD